MSIHFTTHLYAGPFFLILHRTTCSLNDLHLKTIIMRKACILFLMVISSLVRAQQAKPISEENPLLLDGLEYGYSIMNVNTREVNNKDFSRHEVTLYVTNKGACSRVVLFGESLSPFEGEMKTLAKFDCINATGARLTAKSGELSAKPLYVNARVKTRDDKGK